MDMLAEPGLIPAQRRKRIRELITSQGSVRVSTLSELLKVSEITIRRDLDRLEEEGILERTHGGAIYSHHMRVEPLYTEKDRIHREEKREIGRAAAALVEDGDTLLINSGSTTLHIFRHLAGRKDLQVITSNMGALLETQGVGLALIFIGGTYREQSNSLVGPLGMLSLGRVSANKCFIGVDGISRKYGLTTPILREAEIARAMIERTHGQVVAVADHSKLGVVADFVTASVAEVDILVVDDGFDEEYRSELEGLGLEIIIASA
ncbi:MAG: DeoR/GlpR family DNA-binding transcription regulator [Anaerolineae bacterium]|jgi:DeoR/GlpR family transcriptional regulator of sugar metabolism